VLLSEIGLYLHGLGIVTFDPNGVSGDFFISVLPSSPDSCVAVYPTGGYKPDGKLAYDFPTVQLIVRGNQDPRTAYSKAMGIYGALNGFNNGSFVPNGFWVVSCQGIQSAPTHLGQDKNFRHEYSLNFELEIRNISTHRE
jgi:hypothetical protein